MRQRLLWLSVTGLFVVLTTTLAPLMAASATSRTTHLHDRRLEAATRFATLAGAAFDQPHLSAIEPDLVRFQEVYGARITVVDADRTVVASSDPLPDQQRDDVQKALDGALDGNPTQASAPVWPWRYADLVVATPIGRDAQVLGAVVIIQDTGALRADIARNMALLAGGGVFGTALIGWLVAIPLVGWITRPINRLQDGAQRLAAGDTAARVPQVGPVELRELAHAFNTMAAGIELSRRQQRDLVADASHQLSNPLTAIRLRLEALAEQDPQARARLDDVLVETGRMATVLDGLIEISRVGSRDRRWQDVDLAEQLRDRVALWQPVFDEQIRLTVVPYAPARLEPDLVAVITDAVLDNATKYAPGPVEITLGPQGSLWELTFRDHGAGMEADAAAALGRRFVRLPQHRDIDGKGLGLAIIRGRVDDVGGSFSVTAADPGLRIRIHLPGCIAVPEEPEGRRM